MATTILSAILEYFEQSEPLNAAFPGGLWPDFAPEKTTGKPYLLMVDHDEVIESFTAGHADDAGLEEATLTFRVTAAGMKAADQAGQKVKTAFDFKDGNSIPLLGTAPHGKLLQSQRQRYRVYGIDKFADGQPITHADVTYKFWVADQHH